MNIDVNRKYLGFKQASALKGVSISLLRREANEGRLRTRRVFRRRLTTYEWLEVWFESVAKPVEGGDGRELAS